MSMTSFCLVPSRRVSLPVLGKELRSRLDSGWWIWQVLYLLFLDAVNNSHWLHRVFRSLST